MAEDIVVLRTRLADARKAYHDIMLNGSVRTVVDQNGERLEFSAANSGRLAAYILSLEVLVEGKVIGPMNVWF